MKHQILVTGGAGYIGSHAAKALAESGFEPVVFDNLERGHREAVKWGPFIESDLANIELVQQVLKKYKIEAVIHFAANSLVGESMQNPRQYFHNNVVNTLNLLNAMNDAGVKKVVFSSTAATYGDPTEIPITENHSQLPVNPYGESKLFIEKTLRWYGVSYGLQWVALRYFNAAGADPDGEIGEDHDQETHLIPLILQAVSGKRAAIDIYGTDYPTPDGTAVRDYIHVTDLADAHVRALHYLNQGGESIAMNLGTGRGYSVKEVIAMVGKVASKPVPSRETSRRLGDPPVLIASASKAKEILKWHTHYSDLENIVETAWQWHGRIRSKT